MARKQKKGLGYFLAELVILILGISASFILNEIRIENQEQIQKVDLLESFQNNLQADSAFLSSALEVLDRQLESAEKILSSNGEYRDSLVFDFLTILSYAPFNSNDITYQQMSSTGSLSLIKKDSLKNQIVGLYETAYDGVRTWSEIDGEHVRMKLIPYIESNFPFEKGLNYFAATQSKKNQFMRSMMSDEFKFLVQFGQVYKASTRGVYQTALNEINETMEMIKNELTE